MYLENKKKVAEKIRVGKDSLELYNNKKRKSLFQNRTQGISSWYILSFFKVKEKPLEVRLKYLTNDVISTIKVKKEQTPRMMNNLILI